MDHTIKLLTSTTLILLCITNSVLAQAGLGENEQLIKGYCVGRGWSWLGGSTQQGGPMNGWRLMKAHGEEQTITYCIDKKGICQTQFHEFDTGLAYSIRKDKTERTYKRLDKPNTWICRYEEFDRNIIAEEKCQKTQTGYTCYFVFSFDKLL